jgi:hypothetical protein
VREARSDSLLEKAIQGEELIWRGRPSVAAALLDEVRGTGLGCIVIAVLGLLVALAAPLVNPQKTGPDLVTAAGVALFAVALLAVGPPVVLDSLDLRRTRYAVTQDALWIVDGIVFLKLKRVKPPFTTLELKAGIGGTVVLGEVEQERLDRDLGRAGSEKLFTRLRGLEAGGPQALAALQRIHPAQA